MPNVENYSPKDTIAIVSAYTDVGKGVTETDYEKRATIVKQLAQDYGKSERSIRSKLVTQKVYIARETASKVTGEKPEKKEVIAQRVADAFGEIEIAGKMRSLSADSLAKANKTDLSILLYFFNSLVVEDSEINETDLQPENQGELTD